MSKKLLPYILLGLVALDAVILLGRRHDGPTVPDAQENQWCDINYPPEPPKPEVPKVELPTFVNVSVVRQRAQESSYYGDIINHSRNPVLDYDRDTNAHETTHMINSDIRNAHTSPRSNGFYVLEGRGVVIAEPKLRKSAVVEFLPQNLRSYRYSTYISGQGAGTTRLSTSSTSGLPT